MSNNIFLTDEELKRELNYYIDNENIKYATLINGQWGTGKTYFIKEYIKELETKFKSKEDKNRKPIYISMYGINSISELKNKILISMIKNEKLKKAIPLINFGLQIGNDYLEKKSFLRNADTKITDLINGYYRLENITIFFDDIERCSLDINTILGYINELVEHNNVKAILIADETKINNNHIEDNIELKYLVASDNNIKIDLKTKTIDDIFNKKEDEDDNNYNIETIKTRAKLLFDKRTKYDEIKEKLIGKTLYYGPNIEKVYDTFAENMITNEKAKKIVINNKKEIITFFQSNKIYNLRTIQNIFELYNRLTEESITLIKLGNFEELYLNDLFKYCSIKLFLEKMGQKEYSWQDNQIVGNIYIDNNSGGNYFHGQIMGFKYVDEYIKYSSIEKDNVKKDYKII